MERMMIMNLIYRLQKHTKFTTSEKYVAEYILAHNLKILNMSTLELGKETYTSSATIVRFCQKLGFSGFDDFKIQFAQDYHASLSSTKDVNFNYPFTQESSTKEIIQNIVKIKTTSIEELEYILEPSLIDRVVNYIEKADIIDFYGYGTSLLSAYSFELHMNRLNKIVRVEKSLDSSLNTAIRSNNKHLAFVISYSGETSALINIIKELKINKTPVIAITSMTDNTIKRISTINIPITTKESIYSKVAAFSSIITCEAILDIIYSCYYRRNYEKNTKYLLDNARRIEARNNLEIDE